MHRGSAIRLRGPQAEALRVGERRFAVRSCSASGPSPSLRSEGFGDHSSSVAFFRSGTLVQAALRTSDGTRTWQGPFAPRELPRFLTTSAPSDSRHGRPTVMVSRPSLTRSHTPTPGLHTGPLRFPCRSLDARCPVSPRRTRLLLMLVASQAASGFTTSGRLAIPTSVTRPKGFACATADVGAYPGSDARVTPDTAGFASW